jgi:hypothetical protein
MEMRVMNITITKDIIYNEAAKIVQLLLNLPKVVNVSVKDISIFSADNDQSLLKPLSGAMD